MYFDDHLPAHFHAIYGGDEAIVAIESLAVLARGLPPRALGMVTEWASQHQQELLAAWRKAKNLQPPGKVEPLK
jgi:hypothetical protein